MERVERVILAYKLGAKDLDSNMGFVKVLAEYVDGQYTLLTHDNFCKSGKIFITSYYEEIESKFNDFELFRIFVHKTERVSEREDACLYVSQGSRTEKIKPKELIQIINVKLPNPNERQFFYTSVPSTRYIIIKEGSDCFGPFEWTPKDNKDDGIFTLQLMTTPLLSSVNLESGQIFKKDFEGFKESTLDIDGLKLLPDLLEFTNNAGSHDYSSDDELVLFFSKIAINVSAQAEKVKLNYLSQQVKKNYKKNTKLVEERLLRLSEIVKNQEYWDNITLEGLEKFLRGINGELFIDSYIKRNEAKLLEKFKKDKESDIKKLLETKQEELSVILLKLKSKEDESKNLSIEIGRKREEVQKEVLLDDAHRKADIELSNKKQVLDNLETQVMELQKRHSALNTLDKIKREIEFEQRDRDNLIVRKEQIRSDIDLLQEQWMSTEDKLRKKLLDIKPYVDAINGSFLSASADLPKVVIDANFLEVTQNLVEQQVAMIEAIQANFFKSKRFLSAIEIANLLISTQQSFICFLAGLPGVGKTSLSRLFAESQGLSHRLKEASVARGWTSQKDLINFYNPLSNRFQSANTDVYPFLLALEQDKSKDQAMAYILLDEANLSPIEHYWSIFMGKTDNIGLEQSGKLSLGGDQIIAIPKNLRFIATINYDSTTEPLSSRIVDRAPIIVLEGESITQEDIDSLDSKLLNLPISAISLDALFGCDANPTFEQEEKEIFELIRKTLEDTSPEKGKPLHISPRKRIAIQQYCDKARSIMSVFSGESDDLIALDYAVLQHILPQVRGNGKKFAKRLEELKKILHSSGLKKSTAYLERMLNFGASELDTYDFFCW